MRFAHFPGVLYWTAHATAYEGDFTNCPVGRGILDIADLEINSRGQLCFNGNVRRYFTLLRVETLRSAGRTCGAARLF
jgi:hypothetical protein